MGVNREPAQPEKGRCWGWGGAGPQLIKRNLVRIARTAYVGAAMLGGSSGEGLSQSSDVALAAETCLAVNSDLSLGARLLRTAKRLKSGEPLKIVAIG